MDAHAIARLIGSIAAGWLLVGGPTQAVEDLNIEVEVGEVLHGAVGEGSKSVVSVGQVPDESPPGRCREVTVKVGKITRIVLGKGSRSELRLPGTQADECL